MARASISCSVRLSKLRIVFQGYRDLWGLCGRSKAFYCIGKTRGGLSSVFLCVLCAVIADVAPGIEKSKPCLHGGFNYQFLAISAILAIALRPSACVLQP